MTANQWEHLIRSAAAEHHLPPELVTAIVAVESSGRATAKRYEPKFDQRYNITANNPFVPEGVSRSQEERLRGTSWGLMQVMGETARFLGFQGQMKELEDPETCLFWGCLFLRRLRDRYFEKWGWPGVAAAYNAGSPRLAESGKFVNQVYVDKVLRRLGGVWPAAD